MREVLGKASQRSPFGLWARCSKIENGTNYSRARVFGSLVVLFPSNMGIRKYRQVRAPARSEVNHQGLPCSLLPRFLSNREPQPRFALVFRTGDL